MYPKAETTQVVLRVEATGWRPEDEEVPFAGYVVTL